MNPATTKKDFKDPIQINYYGGRNRIRNTDYYTVCLNPDSKLRFKDFLYVGNMKLSGKLNSTTLINFARRSQLNIIELICDKIHLM